MWLIRQVGAVRSTVVTYVMAPIGVILGWLVLDEAITWSLAVGLGLILAGVALVQFERAVWPERPGMRREETTKPQSSASRPS
jgi:drug/metabolite transporter (DMT)-like permease